MIRTNKKKLFMLAVMVLSIGIAIGTVLTADEQLDNLAASEATIQEKVEMVVNEKLSEKKADIQMYVLSADNVDTGGRVHFYFRSDDNPFWRAHKIMEIEGINFENLSIRESDLLDERK